MAVTNEQITSWLQSNPGATDATIASTMQQFGVTPAQMAQATGLDTAAVQARYDAALPAATNLQTFANTGGLGSLGVGVVGAPVTSAAATTAPNYEQMVRDAYGSIGRTGIGGAASNIDQAGFDYWLNTLQSGASTPEAFNRNFQTAVADYLTNKPRDQYSDYVGDVLSQNSLTAATGNTGNAASGSGSNVLGGLILAGDSFLSGSSNVPTIASQTGQNVTSVAKGGSTTNDVINQLNGFIDSGGTFAPGSTVMLNVGGNDLLQGGDPATVQKNINQIVSTLGSLGVNVILSGASNVGSVADVTGSTNLAMSNIYNNVASNNPNVTLVDAMSGLLNQKNLVDETGFHLNAAGQTAFNAALSNAYLNSIGKGNINYTDQAIKDFATANNLSMDQALALAPSFGVSTERVRSALGGDVQNLYTDFLGREADVEGLDYWRNQFGSTIDDTEREIFRQSAATELNKQFGVTGDTAAPTTEGILSGFKYANDSGITEDKLKKTLGEDVFNTYKTGFTDYAKTGIANILADKQLSFDEARTAVKFGRDYGYDAQELADLTGTDKKVFDAIFKNYDDTTNKIVDSVLGAEDVKTNDDKIVRALALQQKFGFTDEDLAKAADFTPAQVKGFLDPVRNFEKDFRNVLTNTDATTADIKKFAEDARTNGAISQVYSKGLGDLDAKITELEDKWKSYNGVDPFQAQRVYDQLDTQRKAINNPNLFRGSFADPMKTAATLSRLGIDTLADIGQKDKFEAVPAEKRYTTSDGIPVDDLGNGTFGTPDGSVVPRSQVKTTYGYTTYETSPDGESQVAKFNPLSDKDVDKDGNYQQKIGTVAIDKDTGKEIAGIDGTIDAEKSGRWNNRKRNELNVGFTKDGVPVLYSTQEKTGFGALVQDLAPMISMALPFVLPGVGAALSSGLASVGGSALATGSLANAALTQGILSGGMTALGGGQFEKGFLGGAASPFVSAGISNLLPTGMNPDLAKSITGAGVGAVRGALQGNANFGDLLQTGILEGVSNYGLNTALGSSGLTPQQLNFATGIAVPLLQGEKVSPLKVLGTAANYLSPQPR